MLRPDVVVLQGARLLLREEDYLARPLCESLEDNLTPLVSHRKPKYRSASVKNFLHPCRRLSGSSWTKT